MNEQEFSISAESLSKVVSSLLEQFDTCVKRSSYPTELAFAFEWQLQGIQRLVYELSGPRRSAILAQISEAQARLADFRLDTALNPPAFKPLFSAPIEVTGAGAVS